MALIRILTFVALLAGLLPHTAWAEALSTQTPAPAVQPGSENAISAAQSWLAVVDAGQFEKSWEEAAPIFKSNVSEDAWKKLLELHRGPLGKLANRELRSKTFYTALPGAPEGNYWVLDYVSTFGDGKKLYERVTPMKVGEKDWKISGYFLNAAGFSN